jgi:hypothetical protein
MSENKNYQVFERSGNSRRNDRTREILWAGNVHKHLFSAVVEAELHVDSHGEIDISWANMEIWEVDSDENPVKMVAREDWPEIEPQDLHDEIERRNNG